MMYLILLVLKQLTDVDIRAGKAAYTGLITVIGEHVDVENIKTLFKVK